MSIYFFVLFLIALALVPFAPALAMCVAVGGVISVPVLSAYNNFRTRDYAIVK